MQPQWKNRRLGMVTNEAATTNSLIPSRKALLAQGFALCKLFSPEHGLSARGADGQLMRDGVDPLTGLPVISLYSEKLKPSEQDLADIDIMLFDIPDVGARFYTYLWTMSHLLEACAQYGKPCVILDRPNPISGRMELAEGPMLETEQASFIGRWPIPVRHSCTLGELALFFNETRGIACQLEVIRCTGWERNMFQPDWGLPFVPTSPAIRDFQAMLLYPGLCLLEATNILEGRGSNWSFQSLAAPWIQAGKLVSLLEPVMEELEITPIGYTPDTGMYAGQLCQGISLIVTEPRYYQPVFTGMLLLKFMHDLYPSDFRWNTYPTLVNPEGKNHLDKLLGVPGSQAMFQLDLAAFIARTRSHTRAADWETRVKNYLLYEQ